jgi:hypothetical protein
MSKEEYNNFLENLQIINSVNITLLDEEEEE